jgi:hypothetical protein
MEVTASFITLLSNFECVFTAPSYLIFLDLISGWVLSHRHRYVTDLIWSSGSTGKGHHSRYHRFFSHAAWELDLLCGVLGRLAVVIFVATGVVIELAVDDTLCRKRGLTVYGAGMHHDPLISSRAKPLTSWGHDWVVLTLIIRHPYWAPTKVWSLPIAFRLYRNRQGLTKGRKGKKPRKADPSHRTRPELAVELICLAASWFPGRKLLVCGDSAYGGQSVLKKLPPNVELISRVHPKGALYEAAPESKKSEKGGRPRKKGKRLSEMAAWADDNSQTWTELEFDQFGLHATLMVKTRRALYYKAGGQRLLTIVLVRDAIGKRPDQMFYCTCLDWDARTILSYYSCRWSIEVTFEHAKQLLGLEDPANRKPKAVERTAPMALVLYSLILIWFHQEGHKHVTFPDRPWYTKKREPSFGDALTTLRRLSCHQRFRGLLPRTGRLKTQVARLIEFLSLAG